MLTFRGIDALETTLAEIHKAIFLASGWTGITLVGGPNPRMGGDLTLKVLVAINYIVHFGPFVSRTC
jgi:hypothetical protein